MRKISSFEAKRFARIFAGYKGSQEIYLVENKLMTKELREFCRLNYIRRVVELSEFFSLKIKNKTTLIMAKKFLTSLGFNKSNSTFIEKFDEMLKKRKKKTPPPSLKLRRARKKK